MESTPPYRPESHTAAEEMKVRAAGVGCLGLRGRGLCRSGANAPPTSVGRVISVGGETAASRVAGTAPPASPPRSEVANEPSGGQG